MPKFLDNVNLDTNGNVIIASGGRKVLAVWATSFGSGTVTLQGSPDGGTTWVTLQRPDGNAATFTSNEIIETEKLGLGMSLRATLTGSSGASNVNAQLFQ